MKRGLLALSLAMLLLTNTGCCGFFRSLICGRPFCGPFGRCCDGCGGWGCNGCGEMYWSDFWQPPLDCFDPCDNCGNWTGGGCGYDGGWGGGGWGGGGCTSCGDGGYAHGGGYGGGYDGGYDAGYPSDGQVIYDGPARNQPTPAAAPQRSVPASQQLPPPGGQSRTWSPQRPRNARASYHPASRQSMNGAMINGSMMGGAMMNGGMMNSGMVNGSTMHGGMPYQPPRRPGRMPRGMPQHGPMQAY